MSALTAAPALPAVPAAQRINRRRPDAQTMQIAHRVAGIEIRKELTDSLKRFSEYVDEAGHAPSLIEVGAITGKLVLLVRA